MTDDLKSGIERRVHERTPLSTPVRITHPSFGAVVVRTKDISHGGVFVLTGELEAVPTIGTVIEGQVQDGVEDRPIVKMKVVRIVPDGIGLQFLE